MSLLKDMIKESAAAGSTPAHAIAHVPGSLFGGGSIPTGDELTLKVPKKFKKRSGSGKMLRRLTGMNESSGLTVARVYNLTEGWLVIESLGASSGETDFSASDVISKLDNAEKKAKAGEDTTAFGMEDEDGNLVKVYVKTESAEDFEKALASMLAGEDENEDDQNSALEIAEVLFKLKDKFEIVDVEWPDIEGDEEEEQEIEGDPEAEGGDMGAEGGDDLGLDAEGTAGGDDDLGMDGDPEGMEEPVDDEADAKSALDKVIDMMKADADAKMAEAKAREAEAKAKEAEHVAKAAQARVSQEEQVLDMETYYKDKQDQEKETKQLAKMAKFKHDTARDAEANLSMESVEEKKDNDPYRYNDNEIEDDEKITHEELATLILKNLRHN